MKLFEELLMTIPNVRTVSSASVPVSICFKFMLWRRSDSKLHFLRASQSRIMSRHQNGLVQAWRVMRVAPFNTLTSSLWSSYFFYLWILMWITLIRIGFSLRRSAKRLKHWWENLLVVGPADLGNKVTGGSKLWAVCVCFRLKPKVDSFAALWWRIKQFSVKEREGLLVHVNLLCAQVSKLWKHFSVFYSLTEIKNANRRNNASHTGKYKVGNNWHPIDRESVKRRRSNRHPNFFSWHHKCLLLLQVCDNAACGLGIVTSAAVLGGPWPLIQMTMASVSSP